MLSSYSLIRSSKADLIEAAWIEHSRGCRVQMPRADEGCEFVANLAPFEQGTLTYCHYSSPMTVDFDAADFTRLIYQMSESSAVLLEGEAAELSSSGMGCLVPGGRRWRARHAGHLEDLAIRIPTATLRRKLAAYLGYERQSVELLEPSPADPRAAEDLRQAVFSFAGEVENADKAFLPNLVAFSFDDVGLKMFTCFGGEALSSELPAAAPSIVQLGRVEQYLVAHYAEPLTLEALADVSGVSARSVIRYFRLRHDCTPQQYVERIRTQMAHVQLRVLSESPVKSVALQCGFSSVAAFERSYRQQFGRLPTARPPI
jgi:AraC-like DNA-binding protein